MRQVVRQVQEVYLDYFPHNPELFTLDVASCMSLEPPHSDHAVLHRIASGITALLLALKVAPPLPPVILQLLSRLVAMQASMHAYGHSSTCTCSSDPQEEECRVETFVQMLNASNV